MRWIDLRFHCLLAQFLPFLVFFFLFLFGGGTCGIEVESDFDPNTCRFHGNLHGHD